MKRLESLLVVPYAGNRIPNDFPGGELSWQAYHTVRNALVRTCRRFGTTGAMGVVKIVADVANPASMLAVDRDFWESGDPSPMYFIVDDQYNHERYCYAELAGSDPLNVGWLLAVVETLAGFEGWALCVSNIPDSYLLIFADKLMVNGKLAKCGTAAEVIEEARRLLRRGPKRRWQFWK